MALIMMALLGAIAASPKLIAAISILFGMISGIIGTVIVNNKKNAVNAAAKQASATKDTSALENTFGGRS